MLIFSSLVLSVALLSATATGSPTRNQISESLLNKLRLYEQYAAAAYCPDNFEAREDRKIRCPFGNCPRVEAADTSVIVSFTRTTLTDTSGFVAVDTTNQLIIVSFRGSESLRNYITDAAILLTSIELCDGCQSSSGFWRAWGEVRDVVSDAVKQAHNENPGYAIVATGHSLGGALATFAATQLRDIGHPIDLASFGAPRIGNDKTVTYIMGQAPGLGVNYRVVHVGDPIPSLPLTAQGYRHINPEYLITTNNEEVPAALDIVKQDGDEDGEGLIGTNLLDAMAAHDWYFNQISGCYEGGLFIPL